MTYSEVEKVEGFIGNFKVTVRKKARKVDEKLCTGCGLCTQKCPNKKIPDAFNEGLGKRTARSTCPFPRRCPTSPSSTP